jgi:hypothetical protein
MQEETVEARRYGSSIETVAKDGMPETGQVDANLVGAAGSDANFEQTQVPEILNHTIVGQS